ncbi:50S ribosomal protein L31 [Candidatus Blochmanniella camponoti]|uniref:Large ribosomal subunit protein bL31 n=1 Tax=Candidatus Blochmanniella camponoti TaxID=108080 RepID=A0AAE9L6B9_9ENTR|nr:50S ribosomal protein L31 [Candidatus Blochmannia herculeanus]URJ24419.1 50S ribosomal protein L31 [Candidatus Blochmannia herculeanus]URJ26972.1 50S ribosomal protein L31 [Candidatus Blochmannia herculeanus]URJ27774.1 50S ribosomal protein L31 [Candidatus Blochmannia herculeanus]
MKKNVHPKYNEISAYCSCGNVIDTKSTLNRNLNIDVCNLCHPFYTGTQRILDTRGRVNIFNKRFNLSINADFLPIDKKLNKK